MESNPGTAETNRFSAGVRFPLVEVVVASQSACSAVPASASQPASQQDSKPASQQDDGLSRSKKQQAIAKTGTGQTLPSAEPHQQKAGSELSLWGRFDKASLQRILPSLGRPFKDNPPSTPPLRSLKTPTFSSTYILLPPSLTAISDGDTPRLCFTDSVLLDPEVGAKNAASSTGSRGLTNSRRTYTIYISQTQVFVVRTSTDKCNDVVVV